MLQMSGISCLNLVVFKYIWKLEYNFSFKKLIGFMVPGCSDHVK